MAAIKLEAGDLESLMTWAMTTAVAAARESQPTQSSSAQGGAETEVNTVAAVQLVKITNFWEDDLETWFMRLEMQFRGVGSSPTGR